MEVTSMVYVVSELLSGNLDVAMNDTSLGTRGRLDPVCRAHRVNLLLEDLDFPPQFSQHVSREQGSRLVKIP
ncbi:hypothetical protein INR49_000070 [Caranx melampygus]|nr:hypothetical protein INR49_000070 [Caranx melampygus]